MGQLRFGTDGVRGRALTELTTDYVGSLGRAAADVVGRGEWLVGRDTRESGPVLEQALIDGLRDAGAEPVRLGVLPTPALAYLSERHAAPAAMITASHNTYHDNGVKIFASGGLKLTDEIERSIETAMGRPPGPSEHSEVAHSASVHEYGDHLVDSNPSNMLYGLRIVLDCANGAMYEAAPHAARRMGADVVVDPAAASPWSTWQEVARSPDADHVPLFGPPTRPAVVFECVGVPGVLDGIVRGCAPGAAVIVLTHSHALDYANHLAGLWRKGQDYAMQQGWITGYEILTNENPRDGEPDVYLLTRFTSFADTAEGERRNAMYLKHMASTEAQMQSASGDRAKYRKQMSSMLLRRVTIRDRTSSGRLLRGFAAC